jgi:hypothetical protein
LSSIPQQVSFHFTWVTCYLTLNVRVNVAETSEFFNSKLLENYCTWFPHEDGWKPRLIQDFSQIKPKASNENKKIFNENKFKLNQLSQAPN